MGLPVNQIVCGDCIEVMKGFLGESIDCVVTDPPYGIGFMGKEWDKALPPREAFKEMFRVLKPGALAFVMSSPRQDVLWRMMRMLEECGFQLKQSFVSWIYKSGFPKAYDVSKGIDKKIGQVNHSIVKVKQKLIRLFDGSGKTRSQIDEECKFRACNYLSLPVEGKRPDPWTHILPSFKKWLKIKDIIGYHKKDLDEIFKEAEREIIGEDKPFGKSWFATEGNVTKPESILAHKWQGWKSITGLKPALECVLMVNKPLGERTIVDNVLRHGVGAINVDACRIPFDQTDDIYAKNPHTTHKEEATYECYSKRKIDTYKIPEGRFPANLLVSDKALDTGKITKSPSGRTNRKPKAGSVFNTKSCGFNNPENHEVGYGDVGDQSRYFDLDAWARHHGFLDVPKASKSEREKGLESFPKQKPRYGKNFSSSDKGTISGSNKPFKNIHPTIKPIKLMAYLIELGCPRQGIVLDPFVGSGTTCIAAKRLRRKWIGIEVNKEYVQIAEARLQSPKELESFFV